MVREELMLSPLRPLLCRHEFYWSERHKSDRCHRCGKTRAADEPDAAMVVAEAGPDNSAMAAEMSSPLDEPLANESMDSAFFDIPAPAAAQPAVTVPVRRPPSAKVLKAQALERRESLLDLLDRIAEGGPLNRRDSLDVLLAVIEDAHSADPVLFGSDAADHFARLHEVRSGLIL
jgi:hypothetical protein